MDTRVEVALFAIAQIFTLVWMLSRQSTQIANLTGWIKDVSALGNDTARLVAYLKGQLEGHIATSSSNGKE
jgi:hypothetical protein